MALMNGIVHDLVTTSKSMTAVDGVVIHTIVGFWTGGKAAHWTTDAKGTIRQHRDTSRQSAANLDGNPRWLAIENEDHGPAFGTWNTQDGHAVPKFTDEQCEAIAKILVWVHKTHKVPLDLVPDTCRGRRGIAYHRQGISGNYSSYKYGGINPGCVRLSSANGKVCPGDRRIDQLISVIIPRARQLAGITRLPTNPEISNVSDGLGIYLYATIETGSPIVTGTPMVAREPLALPGPANDPGSRIYLTTGWGQRIHLRVWYLGEGDHRYLGPEGGDGHVYVVDSDRPGWAPIPEDTIAIHAEWTSEKPDIAGDLRVVFVPKS